jgi:hypothetical protein
MTLLLIKLPPLLLMLPDILIKPKLVILLPLLINSPAMFITELSSTVIDVLDDVIRDDDKVIFPPLIIVPERIDISEGLRKPLLHIKPPLSTILPKTLPVESIHNVCPVDIV